MKKSIKKWLVIILLAFGISLMMFTAVKLLEYFLLIIIKMIFYIFVFG